MEMIRQNELFPPAGLGGQARELSAKSVASQAYLQGEHLRKGEQTPRCTEAAALWEKHHLPAAFGQLHRVLRKMFYFFIF